jgi:D-ribose pyranase
MKKGSVINPAVSKLIAGLGHMVEIVIADAGLPIPSDTRRIDLALTKGIPSFKEILSVVLSEMCVEKAVVAQEMLDISLAIYEFVVQSLAGIEIAQISHADFKQRTKVSRPVIRTV